MKQPSCFRLERLLLPLFAMTFFILFSTTIFGQISGIVYQDLAVNGTTLNTYGVKDANEIGVEGVTVTAYPGAISTTTIADGSYSLATGAGDFRIEFTWPTKTWLQSSPDAAIRNTSVQFVTAPNAAVNFGLHNPAEYSDTANPPLAAPFYKNGSGVGNSAGSLLSTPYNSSGISSSLPGGTGPIPTTVANVEDLGSVWGQAWDMFNQRLFSATFLKRHVGIKDGLGYIYVTDYTSGVASASSEFDIAGINTASGGVIGFGSVCRDAVCAGVGTGIAADYVLPVNQATPNIDLDAYGKVAKIGMGGIAMEENTKTLWAVNLFQRALIKIDVSGASASLPGAGNVDQFLLSAIPNLPVCSGGELRPWAITFHNGRGYLGLVCDASTSLDETDLDAFVLSFDPNNIMIGGFTQELTFDLNYRRTTPGAFVTDLEFDPWIDTYTSPPIHIDFADVPSYEEAVLSDIEFDASGNMYLNFFNRFSHQLGHLNRSPISGNTTLHALGRSTGEVLKICKSGSSWVLEGAAGCPMGYGGGGFGPNEDTFGAGEYFFDSTGEPGTGDGESSNGAWAMLKGSNQIITASMDPNPEAHGNDYRNSQGWNTLNLTTGGVDYFYIPIQGEIEAFGKAGGMGDLELLTAAAPIEIGNLVWDDANSNGIQDAGEPGLSGVMVELRKGAALVSTATTDANGHYIFSNAPTGPGAVVSYKYGLTMLAPNMEYTLTVPTTFGGENLTTANAGEGSNTDINDSDANTGTGVAIVFATAIPILGANNHSFDFGFGPPPCPPARCGTITGAKN